MEKIYPSKALSKNSEIQEKPKAEIIAFLINYSKVLRVHKSNQIGKVEHLLN
jgi:hypothetical protein